MNGGRFRVRKRDKFGFPMSSRYQFASLLSCVASLVFRIHLWKNGHWIFRVDHKRRIFGLHFMVF